MLHMVSGAELKSPVVIEAKCSSASSPLRLLCPVKQQSVEESRVTTIMPRMSGFINLEGPINPINEHDWWWILSSVGTVCVWWHVLSFNFSITSVHFINTLKGGWVVARVHTVSKTNSSKFHSMLMWTCSPLFKIGINFLQTFPGLMVTAGKVRCTGAQQTHSEILSGQWTLHPTLPLCMLFDFLKNLYTSTIEMLLLWNYSYLK